MFSRVRRKSPVHRTRRIAQRELRPTQVPIGMREVAEKRRRATQPAEPAFSAGGVRECDVVLPSLLGPYHSIVKLAVAHQIQKRRSASPLQQVIARSSRLASAANNL